MVALGDNTLTYTLLVYAFIKNGKACGLDEIPIEIWNINEFQDLY